MTVGLLFECGAEGAGTLSGEGRLFRCMGGYRALGNLFRNGIFRIITRKENVGIYAKFQQSEA